MGKRDRFRKRYAGAPQVHHEASVVHEGHKKKRNIFASIYEDHYKALLFFSFALLLFAVILIIVQVVKTGDFVDKGVSLRGGLSATVPVTDISAEDLQKSLTDSIPDAGIDVRVVEELGKQTGLIVESGTIPAEQLINALDEYRPGLSEHATIEEIGSSLSETFFQQTLIALLVAFVFMSIVVFITFRSPAPSAYVVLGAASDVIFTVGMINLFNIQLSTAGVAALLMLVGYSVDTDILLTTRVLRRTEGTITGRTYGAMKTGLMMTGTAIAVAVVGLLLGSSEALKQIMLIILIGLIGDIAFTWLQNAPILRWYLEKRGAKS
jgi:preprotein translocase subunit SecF